MKNKLKEDKFFIGGRVHPHWRKRWKKYAKHDQDWEHDYFLGMILHKIELLKEYYIPDNVCMCEENLQEIQRQLNEVSELGNKIWEDKYDDTALEFADKHTLYSLSIKSRKRAKNGLLVDIHTEGNKSLVVLNKIKDQELANLAKQGYKKSDLTIGYCRDWDSDDSYKQYQDLSKKAMNIRDHDIQLFFKLIGKYYEYWWD